MTVIWILSIGIFFLALACGTLSCAFVIEAYFRGRQSTA